MFQFLADFLPILIVGLSLGNLFGLVGLAFTVIINACQIVNFAQGDFAMLGVAFCWFTMTALGLPLWVAFFVGVIAAGFFGFLTEKAVITPLQKRGAPPFTMILGTMAMGIIAAGVVGVYTKFWWMKINPFLGNEPWKIAAGLSIDHQGVLIIIATILLVVGYWYLLNKTRLGLALRATGFNREVSIILGIQTSRMMGLSFLVSGIIAGIAGILCAPLSAFNALQGLPLAINGFISVIVGGWGNPYAAVLGGITLGLVRALLTGYLSSAHAEMATFVVLIIVLTWKPEGLFSRFMIPGSKKS
jgi:branched-chain amino acid transport system permease protein